MTLKIPPPVVFIMCVLLMLLVDYLFPNVKISIPYRVAISRVLMFLGGFIAVVAILSFRQSETTVNPHKPNETSVLVKSGIYRFTRNPMYLGMLLIILAGVIRLQNPITLISAVIFVGYITRFQIRPEERMLARLFGEEYLAYCKQVRRWI